MVSEFALGNGFGVIVNSKNQVCSFNINKMNPYVIDALEGKSIAKISAGEQHIMALGVTIAPNAQLGAASNIKSYSQSRLSSDGRRSEQLTGKISRQQSAAQLNAMLSQQKNQEMPGSQIVKKSEAKAYKKPFQYCKTKENGDDVENYQTQCYSNSNARSVTPTQNKKYGTIRNPLQHSNCQTQEYTSVNSVIGASKSSLFVRQNVNLHPHDDSAEHLYQKKLQDRCKSEYLHHNADNRDAELDELRDQLAELKQQLNEKDNQMVVLQSECHDTTLKLNRKIRQLEDQLDQRDKKILKLQDA